MAEELSTTDRLRAVDVRRGSLVAQRARDEVELQNADTALTEARAALETEFGIKTSADLANVKGQLEADLEAAVAEAEKQLEAAGA